ncbi:MAG: DNA-binding MarR family transcriptional regulator [Gammaproteobacteria bacterium]|jgi:DNA-binding MarR family transcriptional regulator
MNAPNCGESLTLEILEIIDSKSDSAQRHIAQRTGAALGLANSYLKRCIRKGLVKIQQAPANRYLYYLTPKGLAEESRLTSEYLSYSFSLYRQASEELRACFQSWRDHQTHKVGLFGVGDLVEVTLLRAMEQAVSVSALCDPFVHTEKVLGHDVVTYPSPCSEVQVWVLVRNARSWGPV